MSWRVPFTVTSTPCPCLPCRPSAGSQFPAGLTLEAPAEEQRQEGHEGGTSSSNNGPAGSPPVGCTVSRKGHGFPSLSSSLQVKRWPPETFRPWANGTLLMLALGRWPILANSSGALCQTMLSPAQLSHLLPVTGFGDPPSWLSSHEQEPRLGTKIDLCQPPVLLSVPSE